MDLHISEIDKSRLREIYFELRSILTSINSLDRLEALLSESIRIAEFYGRDEKNSLLSALVKTREKQLKIAKLTSERKYKIRAVADLQLFIQGDLLGWF